MNTSNDLLLNILFMQASLIFFIILCFVNPSLKSLFSKNLTIYKKTTSCDKLIAWSIAISFIINLIYLILNIIQNLFPQLGVSNLAIFIFNIIATSFLYIAAIVFLVERFVHKERQQLIFISIFIIGLLTFFVIRDNWHNKSSNGNTLAHFYSMCGCVIVAFCFFYQYQRLKLNKANSSGPALFIGCGFILWGMIQFLPDFGWDEKYTDTLGFSISTICKFLILFGSYLYIIKVSTFRAQEKNLKFLQDLIYEISSLKKSKDIAKKVTEHLTSKNDIFGYDYAIFSDVDYLKQKIVYKESSNTNENIHFPEDWVGDNRVSFDDSDIMARVLEDRIPYFVDNKYWSVDEWRTPPVDDTKQAKPILNKFVYEKFKHEYLNRILVPVFSSKNIKNDYEGRVVAIIEVGHYEESLKHRPIIKTIYNEDFFRLYLDSVAQAYVRVFSHEIEAEIKNHIEESDKLSNDYPAAFLKITFDKIFNYLNIKHGTFSRLADDIKDSVILHSSDTSIEENQKILVSINEGNLILLSFHQDDYSFEITRKPLEKHLKDIFWTHEEKRYRQYLANLAVPERAVIDVDSNLQSQIDFLQKFFYSSHTNVWIKDNLGNLICKYYSNKLEISSFPITEINISKNTVFQINDPQTKSNPFVEIGKKHSMSCFICIPLKLQNSLAGIINIYFNNRNFTSIGELSIEEQSILNLFSTKLTSNLLLNKLISSFRNITNTFAKNDLKSTLKMITNQASELLAANPVFLYQSNDGKKVFHEDSVHSINKSLHDDITLLQQDKYKNYRVELAEFIIKDGNQYFDDEKDFKNYISQKRRSENCNALSDFWNLEKIESMAAIRLTKGDMEDTAVGVMFINYRNSVSLKDNEEIKRIIDAFAFFASGCISNAIVLKNTKDLLMRTIKMAKPLLQQTVLHGLLHDAKRKSVDLSEAYDNLIDSLDSNYGNKDLTYVRSKLNDWKKMFRQLFDAFAKVESVYRPDIKENFKEINVVGIIKTQIEILKTAYAGKRVKIEPSNLDKAFKAIWVECDESLLGNAFYNILNNAHQAIENRTGEIKINIMELPDNKVKINFTDSGKGISEDIKKNLFYPYLTDKGDDGSGLGLSITKYIIETMHHGMVYLVESRPGKTKFEIILNKIRDNV